MSRIRTIKPEFWVSEQVIACSQSARLLFIGLLNFCDDSGVHPRSFIRLKAEIFPADDCNITDIKQWINELITNELLREYSIDDKSYWIVTGWKSHQKIDKPSYRHPLPQSELKKIADESSTIRRGLDNSSPIAPLIVNEYSTTESNGMESKEMEEDMYEVKTSLVDVSVINISADKKELFIYWTQKMNHPRAKLDKKRESVIQKALELGYSVVDLKQAIDGCAQTPFNMGKNDRQQIYDDISLIFRDAEHIERFINNANNPSNEKEIKSNIMSGVL